MFDIFNMLKKNEENKVTDAATTETVTVGEKKVCLGWTAAELKAVWGEPDRIDDSVYGLERYVYLNKYQNYFFATMQDGKIVEIFVPGTDFCDHQNRLLQCLQCLRLLLLPH